MPESAGFLYSTPLMSAPSQPTASPSRREGQHELYASFHLSAGRRSEEVLVIDPPGDEVGWRDAQDFRREIFHDLLPPFRKGLNPSSHLDATSPPGR